MQEPTIPTRYFQNALGVFQGGGCRGSAYVGAYRSAIANGVNFAEIAGTSAGSIIAALIGAGASPDYLEKRLKQIDYSKFLAPYKNKNFVSLQGRLAKVATIFMPLGLEKIAKAYFDSAIYSSDYIYQFVDESLSELLCCGTPTFRDTILPTHIVGADLQIQRLKIWNLERTPDVSIATAVQASCSIPFFFPPVDNRYVDGGILSNLPTFIFAEDREPATTRVLAFSLLSAARPKERISAPDMFVKSLVDTIIDGSGEIQSKLFTVSCVEIDTGDIGATDFAKIDDKSNDKLIQSGAAATSAFFASEAQHLPVGYRAGLLPGLDEMRAVITERLLETVKRVDVVEEDTDFIYKLFPSFLHWRTQNVNINVKVPRSNAEKPQERYRRALLRFLGVNLDETESEIRFRGYFFDAQIGSDASALIGPINKIDQDQDAAVFYSGLSAQPAISALHRGERFEEAVSAQASLALESADQRRLLEKLRLVKQYQNCLMTLETITLSELKSLTPFVHEFKFRQIPSLIEIYRKSNIPLFEPCEVKSQTGYRTLVTPPVLESIDGQLVLVEGTTRATWLLKNGIKSMRAVVIHDVNVPLPGDMLALHRVRVVHNSKRDKARYGAKFNYDFFRKIEESVHSIEDFS